MKPLHKDERFQWVLKRVPSELQIAEMHWPVIGIVWIKLDDGSRYVSRDFGHFWYQPSWPAWAWIYFHVFLHAWLPIFLVKRLRPLGRRHTQKVGRFWAWWEKGLFDFSEMMWRGFRMRRIGKNEFILVCLLAIIALAVYISKIADTWEETLGGFGLIMLAMIFGVFALLFPSNANLRQVDDGEEDE